MYFSESNKNILVVVTVLQLFGAINNVHAVPVTSLIEDVDYQLLDDSSEASMNHLTPPPQYMLELYSDVAFADRKVTLPYGATTVSAAPASESVGGIFVFNVPKISVHEEILEVEFHLHHGQFTFHNNSSQIVTTRVIGTETSSRQLVESNEGGWLKFRLGAGAIVSDCTKTKCPSTKSITISVTATNLLGEEGHVKLHHGQRKSERTPLIVIFSKSDKGEVNFSSIAQHNVILKHSRLRRSLQENELLDNHLSFDSPNGCNRVPMIVNFREIGWMFWVIHPTEYNAYTCSGSCQLPLGQEKNPTNHAIVQSLMTYVQGNETGVAEPHCVPNKYSELPMLYYDNDESIRLRNFDDMVVESCGCR